MTESVTAYSEQSIRLGSRSFARAAALFEPDIRRSVMMLYAWCRHCDDVIDGQVLGHGQRQLSRADKFERLRMLREETDRVCAGQDSALPAFAALRQVLRRHDIPRRHLFDLLEGFEHDAAEAHCATLDDTLRYCYHVAGVVGVMMACIMDVRDEEVMHRAADLGIAFQLTNIARDVREDLRVGRCYLPMQWLEDAKLRREDAHLPEHAPALHALACELVSLAESYYASARVGIAQLPWRCAWAISSALLIYRDIGLQLRARGPSAWEGRLQVSDGRKLWRLCGGLAIATVSVAGGRKGGKQARVHSRDGLWTRETG